ncbi:MAG: hypothetical protein ABSH28_12035 [Acidobacteriota bacterium]
MRRKGDSSTRLHSVDTNPELPGEAVLDSVQRCAVQELLRLTDIRQGMPDAAHAGFLVYRALVTQIQTLSDPAREELTDRLVAWAEPIIRAAQAV